MVAGIEIAEAGAADLHFQAVAGLDIIEAEPEGTAVIEQKIIVPQIQDRYRPHVFSFDIALDLALTARIDNLRMADPKLIEPGRDPGVSGCHRGLISPARGLGFIF